MNKCLIITADDFGFSKERNRGVLEAFYKSAIKSASLLINCTGTEEAARFFQSHDLCPGLHLNLTEGHHICRKKHATLTDSSGNFWGKFELRRLLNNGKIDHIEIEQEICSQIERFTELVGAKPHYVDGHQHIHVHPDVVDIFARTLQKYSIQGTRYPVEVSLDKKDWVKSSVVPFYHQVMNDARNCRSIFDSYNIKYSHAFVGLSTMGVDMTIGRLQSGLLEAFQNAEESSDGQAKSVLICELMVHPGYATGLNDGGFEGHSDEFGCSKDREHEIQVLASQQMLKFYEKNNIKLVSHDVLLEESNN